MKIKGTIEVGKINKATIFEAEKTGRKYLDIYITETKSEYADFVIMESPNKEMRERGIEGQIIGNASVYDPDAPKKEVEKTEETEESDDLPF